VYNSAKKLGQNIKKIRLAKGLTQGDLCRRLKVDRSYMSHLESGKKNPTLLTIERVAKALNVTVEKLVR
jgi:transcriptional regulator with XRE-family HTH domain